MPTDIQTLESLELFKEFSAEDLEEIAEIMNPISVKEGELLTKRDDTAHTFYITLSGNFMIHFKEGRAFTLHGGGNIIGMSTVLTPFNYRGTTVALTDGEVLAMPGSRFLELVQSNSSIGEHLMHKLNDIIAERAYYAEGPGKEEEETEDKEK
jgi:CRP-like cAMP-binding protein